MQNNRRKVKTMGKIRETDGYVGGTQTYCRCINNMNFRHVQPSRFSCPVSNDNYYCYRFNMDAALLTRVEAKQ
jgi:hypothetical protein